jgi:hypothetical protein
MKISLLGWGSLIWNPGSLHVTGEWKTGGPILPIEFSRISDNGRLTLVIDEKDGAQVPTRFAFSSLIDLQLAITDLKERENTPYRDRIGYLDLPNNKHNARAWKLHPKAYGIIRAWAEHQKIDAVVWTAIGPRFVEKTGEPFSPDAALRYLATLKGDTRVAALKYIREAPAEVATPVRDLVNIKYPLKRVG